MYFSDKAVEARSTSRNLANITPHSPPTPPSLPFNHCDVFSGYSASITPGDAQVNNILHTADCLSLPVHQFYKKLI